MNTQSSHKQPISLITTMMALVAITFITACSPKPSTEDGAAQTKAIVDQAVVEAKKQILAEQAAEKAKQEALIAAQAEEKVKQDAVIAQAVAAAKKELLAEQAAAAKAKSHTASTKQVSAAATPNAPSVPTSSTPKKMVCTTCGVVLSVNEIETEGKGSGLGVVAGGVVGGLLGNQVGQGTGRDLATIAGAVGGAIAGNKIEKSSKKTKSFDITVKMETGEAVVFNQATLPNVVKGDAVKIENGAVIKK